MQAIKRFFAILFGALAMCLVAALFAFVSMRIAIHGREVEVPNLAGKSDAEAAAIARSLGLNLSVENRFYSPAVPPNAVLSQLPVAGSRVRSGWQIRITESLGPQQSTVPDVTGTPERAATVVLRRLQLEVATVAHIPAPGPSGIVLAQSPPPNSHGMNGPDVSLLVSDEETSADLPGYVMPSLVGLTVGAASSRLATAGLHIASAEAPSDSPDLSGVDAAANPPGTVATPSYAAPAPELYTGAATITSQSPAPGHRVTHADTIRVSLSH